jgi:hypothetical protein
MRARQLVAAVLLLIGLTASAWAQNRDKPSTPEERQRALLLTKKLEESPLGPEAAADRKWLTRWIIEIPDISVPVCEEMLKPLLAGEVTQYRYSKEIVAQQLAGGMAYLIQHPSAAEANAEDQDQFAINKAGLESALNAYEAIVKQGVKGAKWGPLEEMVKKRANGQLDDYVRAATLSCMTGDTNTASLGGLTITVCHQARN